jgi:two-component system response regulator AtoC
VPRSAIISPATDAGEILDGIPVPIAVLDLNLRVKSVNRALETLTGFSREEAAGVPSCHIIRSNLCPTQRCPGQEARAQGEPIRTEGDIINRSRQKIPVRITVALIKDATGAPLGLIETVEDISLLRELHRKVDVTEDFGGLVGQSPEMQKLLRVLPVIAQTDASVLMTGETGTGKDVVAAVLHRLSRRVQGPFIKVNCGALPETLLESELFGHVRGAFTGAVRDKPGRFQLADGGTLYLTELGDLPLPLQVKLLTFLDDREFHPLGGTRSVKADVRLVAATHRDLAAMVRQGTFREDLLFRLNVVRLELPALRERRGDARLLAEYFLHQCSRDLHKPITGFSPQAIEVLTHYPYPGNVRELKNIIEYAAIMCPGEHLEIEHLPDYLINARAPHSEASIPETGRKSDGERVRLSGEIGALPGEGKLDWNEMERRMIAEALLKSRGNRSTAANLLGWGRATLWRKMKRHGLS